MTKAPQNLAVGIDLGTTFSAISYLDADGKPQTIRNTEGELTTPSAVFFDKTHPVVGDEAIDAGIMEPDRLAMFAKRNMGETSYSKLIRGESLPPEVVQAIILKKLLNDAEPKLGKIEKAVVTVPAFFNEPCRKATQDAGRLIGLDVIDIINEPTAAAITYGVETGFLLPDGSSRDKQNVLVYDLGGGTFDVTIMEIQGSHYRAIATAGDVYLGGIDWDKRIVDFMAEQFKASYGSDPSDDRELVQELMKKAAQAKRALSQRDEYSLVFTHDGHRFKMLLTREKLEALTLDLVDRTLLTMQMVLADAEMQWSDLSRVILVGGSTRMPMIKRAVEAAAGAPVDRTLSPDEAISHGAAIYAGLLMKRGGATIDGMSVQNVNSHDLGVLAIEPETNRPRRQIMIERNTQLPATHSARFRTHLPNQPNVKIQLIEGGDDSGNNATHIGKCVVDQLPTELPKGSLVDVEFKYAADGRLRVTASLPDIDREVRLVLYRVAGLKNDRFEYWRKRIAAGMPDSEVPAPKPQVATAPSGALDLDGMVEMDRSPVRPPAGPAVVAQPDDSKSLVEDNASIFADLQEPEMSDPLDTLDFADESEGPNKPIKAAVIPDVQLNVPNQPVIVSNTDLGSDASKPDGDDDDRETADESVDLFPDFSALKRKKRPPDRF